MRLIDADAVAQEILLRCNQEIVKHKTMRRALGDVARTAYECVKNAEAVDAKSVRHGRWIAKGVDAIVTKFQCSECGRTVECCNDYFGKPTKHVSSTFPYCHCGAKMRGDEDTDE